MLCRTALIAIHYCLKSTIAFNTCPNECSAVYDVQFKVLGSACVCVVRASVRPKSRTGSCYQVEHM